MLKSIRIAMLHLAPYSGEIIYNRKQIRRGLAIAAGYEADVALTPELAECGKHFESVTNKNSIPGLNYDYMQSLGEVAIKYKMHLLIGRPERNEYTGEIYNGLTHINTRGNIQAHYRKQVQYRDIDTRLIGANEPICTCIKSITIGLLIGEDGGSQKVLSAYKSLAPDLLCWCVSIPEENRRINYEECVKTTGIPTVICNGLIEAQKGVLLGRTLCLSPKVRGSSFIPYRPEVIITDYSVTEQKFYVIARVCI